MDKQNHSSSSTGITLDKISAGNFKIEMKYLVILLVLIEAYFVHGSTGRVVPIQFKTAFTPPPCRIPDSLKQNEQMFRISLNTLPEGLLVAGALVVGYSDLRILMINSTEDMMVPINIVRKQVKLVKQHVPELQYKEVSGNHFFLLSDRKETFGTIRKFMENKSIDDR